MGDRHFDKAIKQGQEKIKDLQLKIAREKMGLNQTDLKGLTQPEVSKIESRKDLKISTLRKYAKALELRVKISFVSEDNEEIQDIRVYG